PGIQAYCALSVSEKALEIFTKNRLWEQDLVLTFPTRVDWNKDITKAIEIIGVLNERGVRTKLVLAAPRVGSFDDFMAELFEQLREDNADKKQVFDRLLRPVTEKYVVFADTARVQDPLLHRQLIMDLLALSDFLLFPSWMETFGMPLLEAASVRTGVIASDLPAHQETMRREAMLMDLRRTPQDIAEDIIAHIQSNNFANRKSLQERILNTYTWQDLMINQFIPLLQNIIDGRPLASLAVANARAGEHEQAFRQLLNILRVAGHAPQMAAMVLDRMEGMEEIINAHEREIHSSPDYVYELLRLMLQEIRSGQTGESLSSLDDRMVARLVKGIDAIDMLRQDHRHTGAINQVGHLFLEQGLGAQAQRVYFRVVEIDARNTEALNGLARVFHRRGLDQKAREAYFGVLRIDPENRDALNGLAELGGADSAETFSSPVLAGALNAARQAAQLRRAERLLKSVSVSDVLKGKQLLYRIGTGFGTEGIDVRDDILVQGHRIINARSVSQDDKNVLAVPDVDEKLIWGTLGCGNCIGVVGVRLNKGLAKQGYVIHQWHKPAWATHGIYHADPSRYAFRVRQEFWEALRVLTVDGPAVFVIAYRQDVELPMLYLVEFFKEAMPGTGIKVLFIRRGDVAAVIGTREGYGLMVNDKNTRFDIVIPWSQVCAYCADKAFVFTEFKSGRLSVVDTAGEASSPLVQPGIIRRIAGNRSSLAVEDSLQKIRKRLGTGGSGKGEGGRLFVDTGSAREPVSGLCRQIVSSPVDGGHWLRAQNLVIKEFNASQAVSLKGLPRRLELSVTDLRSIMAGLEPVIGEVVDVLDESSRMPLGWAQTLETVHQAGPLKHALGILSQNGFLFRYQNGRGGFKAGITVLDVPYAFKLLAERRKTVNADFYPKDREGALPSSSPVSSPMSWMRFNRGGVWTPFLGRVDAQMLSGISKHLRKKGARDIEDFNAALPSFQGRTLRFRVINDMPLMEEFVGGRINKDGELEVYFSSEDLVARFGWEFSSAEEKRAALQCLASHEFLPGSGSLREEDALVSRRVSQLVLDETAREREAIRQAFQPLGYGIIEKLSVGGNARVYKARKDDGTYTAIKLEKARARKKHDARILQELINRIGRFRYVMSIEGHASAIIWGESRQFVVLEYVEGKDLKQIIEDGEIDRWSFGQVLNTLFMLAQAVAYFHAQGLSHTDVALHNVMITPSGDVKLIDYDRPYSVKFRYKDIYCLQRVMTQVLMKSVKKRIKLDKQQVLSLWFRSPVGSDVESLTGHMAEIVKRAFKYPWRYTPAARLAERMGHVLGEYRTLDAANTASSERSRENGPVVPSPAQPQDVIQQKAIEILKAQAFPALSVEALLEKSRLAEEINGREAYGLAISPNSAELVEFLRSDFTDPNSFSTEVDISALRLVECHVYEIIRKQGFKTLWSDNLILIMGDGIYHKDGRLFDDDELEKLGLRLVRNPADGQPLTVQGLVNSERTVSLPGPWVVPFIRTQEGGEMIIINREMLAKVTGEDVRGDNLNEVLLRQAAQGKIGLRLAAALEFKGSGRCRFWARNDKVAWLRDVSGKNIYVPGLANSSYGAENWPTFSAIGALRESTEKHIALQNDLLARGAVFSGLEIAGYKLFDRDMLPEIDDGLDYKEVWMTQRLSFTTCRASMFLYEWASDSGASVYTEVLLPWLRKYYGPAGDEELKHIFLKQLYAAWGRNLRAALPLKVYRTSTTRLPGNWGPHMELVDLGGLEVAQEAYQIKSGWDWVVLYMEAIVKTLLYREGRSYEESALLLFSDEYFYNTMLPEIFSGDDLRMAREYFKGKEKGDRWNRLDAGDLMRYLLQLVSKSDAGQDAPSSPVSSSSPVNTLTAQSMTMARQRYSHSRYQEEPYIARGFAQLEDIFLRVAAYEYLQESGKIHGPPESVRDQVESFIAAMPQHPGTEPPSVQARLYQSVISRSDRWGRSRRIILRNIFKRLQYPSYQIDWTIAHIDLHQKAADSSEAVSRQFRRLRVEYRAALSDFILSAADWNFRIYILTTKRMAAEDQAPYREELFRISDEIRQKLVFFKDARLGEELLGRFSRVDDLLLGLNEPAVNMILMSALIAARNIKVGILRRKLRQERHTPPQRLRRDEDGFIRLRGQRYERAGSWNMAAVKEYGDLAYRSLWDALRAVDHMVDSELDEIRWIYNLMHLLDRFAMMNEDPVEIRKQVVVQLQELQHVMVEEKILARIILGYSLELLDLSPQAFIKISGLFAVSKQFLALRVAESRAIVRGLNMARVSRLRQEVEQKQNALKARAFKALKQLSYGYLRLPRMILEQDLLNSEHPAYLDPREPETAALAAMFQDHVRPVLARARLTKAELEQVKEAFTFLKNKVIVAITLNRFMEAYRNRFVESHLGGEGISRGSAFIQTFKEFLDNARYHVVRKYPALYWAIFYQAAFVSRYTQAEEATEEPVESALFRSLSDHILQTQLRLSQAKDLPQWFPVGTYVLTGEEQQMFDAVISGDRERSFREEEGNVSSPVTGDQRPVVVFVGLPCSGKTTIGRAIAESLGVPFVSIGELLRRAARARQEAANAVPEKKIKEADIYNILLSDALRAMDISRGLICDTSPKTRSSFRHLPDVLGGYDLSVEVVVVIGISQRTARERWSKRQRYSEIRKNIFNRRVREYRKVICPLVEELREKTQVIFIDANEKTQAVLIAEVMSKLGKVFSPGEGEAVSTGRLVSSSVAMAEGSETITFGPSQPLPTENAEGHETITSRQAKPLQTKIGREKVDNTVLVKSQWEYTRISKPMMDPPEVVLYLAEPVWRHVTAFEKTPPILLSWPQLRIIYPFSRRKAFSPQYYGARLPVRERSGVLSYRYYIKNKITLIKGPILRQLTLFEPHFQYPYFYKEFFGNWFFRMFKILFKLFLNPFFIRVPLWPEYVYPVPAPHIPDPLPEILYVKGPPLKDQMNMERLRDKLRENANNRWKEQTRLFWQAWLLRQAPYRAAAVIRNMPIITGRYIRKKDVQFFSVPWLDRFALWQERTGIPSRVGFRVNMIKEGWFMTSRHDTGIGEDRGFVGGKEWREEQVRPRAGAAGFGAKQFVEAKVRPLARVWVPMGMIGWVEKPKVVKVVEVSRGAIGKALQVMQR
ncbi:MAG TPA: nucleoside monophosphate kinase, partial [Candidatus Omnitrophota bacterium]|nr:nucleoside monophosphate kinase [Candidatus Omnitrophota bacterium]